MHSSAGSSLPVKRASAVKSRHSVRSHGCPLYPQKQTLELSQVMSALCQKRTSVRLATTLYPCRYTVATIGNLTAICEHGLLGLAPRPRERETGRCSRPQSSTSREDNHAKRKKRSPPRKAARLSCD